ncbi:MAG: type II toxin-antitoxin system PemK/MazF family toxin [Alicyclobacillus sp.]|nr:type II toxin-antitoxin system PemK/MazF family toxin [Alicyclobacillus sp.]
MSRNDHVVVAFISSKVSIEPLPSDIFLQRDTPEFEPTGLKVSSVIRLHRLASVSTRIVRFELGHIADGTKRLVRERLAELFGLDASD